MSISGTLLPERYIAAQLLTDAAAILATRNVGPGIQVAHSTSSFERWWRQVERLCGPATPLRTIFDLVAMPFFGMLRFRCVDARFEGGLCRARLVTGGETSVALLLTCWAVRASSQWVELARHARSLDADWGIVLSPPFVAIVPTRGFARRRAIELRLPGAILPASLPLTLTLCGADAFERRKSDGTTHGRQCLLDLVLDRAAEFRDAVRSDLQQGVEQSLRALTPVVGAARRVVRPGLPGRAALDEALTLVYRLLFLLFAESRALVPFETAIYRAAYAVSTFCREAGRGSGLGLWSSVAAASRLCRLGCATEDLEVTPFNGALFARSAAPQLEARSTRSRRPIAARCDEAMRSALVALGSRRTPAGVEAIDYRDLGVEQLGSVYERVLDLDPQGGLDPTEGRVGRHSGLRRRTGTFYTPQPLAELVVRQTLRPLLAGRSADRILDLRILDPSMGSGAFLVAACRHLGTAYEQALIEEGRIRPDELDENERAKMRRLVAERCLAGVDRNPMAVQLARLSLWLTTLARDRPLTFLDHRLRTGDSLLGAWPGDLWRLSMRRRAPAELPLFGPATLDEALAAAIAPLRSLMDRPSDTVEDVRAKEASWRRLTSLHSPLHRWQLALHVWCARWFTDGGPGADATEIRAVIDALVRGDRTLTDARLEAHKTEAASIARSHGFFHWPLEFPDVFADPRRITEGGPGFDAVIGNPPWEMVRRDDGHDVDVRRLLTFVRQSGLFPSCTHGHLNLYQAFVDRSLSVIRPGGRLGLVLPWGVAVDDGAAPIRTRFFAETELETIVGIDNARGLFPIHRGLRIAVLSTTAGRPTGVTRGVFGVRSGEQLDALPERPDAASYPIAFTPAEIEVMSGPARRVPDLRRTGDRDLLLMLCRRFPRLGSREGWHVSFGRELNATDVRPSLSVRGIPVIEGKHLAPFVVDGSRAPRLPLSVAERMLTPSRWRRPRVGYRDVSGVGNRLTLIAAVVPSGMVTTHTVLCVRNVLPPERQHFLCALLNSYVLNAVVRLLMGGHVTTSLAEHLPAPDWRGDALDCRIARMAGRLASGQAPVGLEARLQALVARRFALDAKALRHVLDGFPLVPAATRAAVLAAFDRHGRSRS